MEIEEKVVKAACEYLRRMAGYDVLEEDFDGFIVAVNDFKVTVFIKVTIGEEMPDVSRDDFEKAVIHYLTEHADTAINGSVRYDVIRMLLTEDRSRALVCHHVDVSEEWGNEHVDIQ